MQGKKKLERKIFVNYCLEDYVPEDNFYRILDKHLDLSFLYKLTRKYYSHTGQLGLDPVVFFKCLLIAYLENICFDRALERQIKMRMDLRYFISMKQFLITPPYAKPASVYPRRFLMKFSIVYC